VCAFSLWIDDSFRDARAGSPARALVSRVPVLVILVTKVVAGSEVRGKVGSLFKEPPPPPAELVNVPVSIPRDHVVVLDDSLFGRSGKVRFRLLGHTEAEQVAGLKDVFGAAAIARPAVLAMSTVDDPQAFSFITMRPWHDKQGAYVGPYRMGWWPGERTIVAANYENPVGFIEVTPEQPHDTAVRTFPSQRFRDARSGQRLAEVRRPA
jgi:hypothetical protein